MAVVRVELCCLQPFPADINPLDALLSRDQLEAVFGTDTEPQAVLFTPDRAYSCRSLGLLLTVHGTELEQRLGGVDSVVQLWVSPLLLSLCRDLKTGTVQVLDPVALDRVVLGVRGRSRPSSAPDQSLSGLQQQLCGPLLHSLVQTGLPLIREPQSWLVLDCSPVSRGRITAETTVVLTDCSDWPDPLEATPPAPCRPIRLCVSDFAVFSDELGGRSLLDHRRLLETGFTGFLQALECRLDVLVSSDLSPQRLSDLDGCVFVSKALLLRLGLFNRQWVRLSRGGGARERLVSVVTTEEQEVEKQEAGLISTTLWFNLTEGEPLPVNSTSLRLKRWCPAYPGPARTESSCRSAAPPFASELHLQPVSSPLYNSSSLNFDQLLTEHFSTARLVSEGDVVSVPVQNHPDLRCSEGLSRTPVLYFKVQSITSSTEAGGGAYLADREHTSLFMGAVTNSPAPFCSVGGASFWSSVNPPGLTSTVDALCETILPHLQLSSHLGPCTVLVHGSEGSGKMTAIRAAAHRLHLHLLKVDCVTLTSDSLAASEVKLAQVFVRSEEVRPCVLLLRNLQSLLRPTGTGPDQSRLQTALNQLLQGAPSSVVVIATVSRPRDLSGAVMAAFVHQVALESPTEDQRRCMLQALTLDLDLGPDVDLERLSKLTAGFVLGDLSALVAEAGRAACRRLLQTCVGLSEEDLCLSGVCVRNQDFTTALKSLQNAQAKAVGAPKVPDVRWQDVGGLLEVKRQILDTVELPLNRPELLSLGLTRTGLLLYGPPGTGKTLLAKAVATECSMTFLSVKGPELINMYVGQSEENVREVFSRARAAAPCVVFFDELDSLAPSRGRSGDSGGVMDRVVSQLLSELDALPSGAGVFVIGATNRPDLIDQSLLRPGRFDKLVYVGINEDRESQLQVLQAVLRKFDLDPSLDLAAILDRCPGHMTGADLYALCSDAMTTAVKRKVALIEQNLDTEDSLLSLSEEDFSVAVENFRPSVSERELLRYQALQQTLSEK